MTRCDTGWGRRRGRGCVTGESRPRPRPARLSARAPRRRLRRREQHLSGARGGTTETIRSLRTGTLSAVGSKHLGRGRSSVQGSQKLSVKSRERTAQRDSDERRGAGVVIKKVIVHKIFASPVGKRLLVLRCSTDMPRPKKGSLGQTVRGARWFLSARHSTGLVDVFVPSVAFVSTHPKPTALWPFRVDVNTC